MTDRRSLVEGLKATPAVDPSLEKEFVFKAKSSTREEGRGPTPPSVSPTRPVQTGRAPISTRIRADYADALKRASLERQLAKVEPNTISDILEAALEPWLKANGYLS